MPNLKFLDFTVPEILGGSQNSVSGSRDPHLTPFDLFFFIFLLLLTAIHLCAKFEVSNFYRSGDIRGQKIPKVGHVTPT